MIGANGAGKTTLLKKIAEELLNRNDIKAEYMPQTYEDLLDLDVTPVDYLDKTGDKEERTRIRTYLGSLKYTPDEMEHPIRELSGGQKAKVLLLRMSLSGANVLILDEPTRNFSPLSGPVIRKMLREFPGAVISISHDVILLYGDSGLGKTESAQYMAELMGGKLLRKQFSMYQNNESANYIFGGRYNEKSFAQDLLARETNVLLFDEFDKALSVFHSAFYQLFDEGIYEDHNYKVVVNKAIIVCTSNYKTIDEIKEHLGLPIYNRFDSIIKFDDLPDMAKEKIAEREIERLKKDYDIEDRELFDKIKEGAVTQSNAREIKHLIKETFSLVALKKICGETEI